MLNAVTIFASSGEAEYFGGVAQETTGRDISATTIQLALGNYDKPPATGWDTPDLDEVVNLSTRRIKKLIDSNISVGVHWLWVRIADNPEDLMIRFDEVLVVE